MSSKLVLVEDDATLGFLMKEYLSSKAFDVFWLQNGKEALQFLEQNSVDLAIIDVMMPEMDGFTLAKKINELHLNIPFVFLTARSMKIDAIKGLQLGAIDYIRKPIDEEELVLKLQNILALQPKKEDLQFNIITVGKYQFSHKNQELLFESTTKKLTKRENDLLEMLLEKRNQIVSHTEILEKLWGEDDYFNRQSLNVFITRLRKYVSQDESISIENIHNQGFRLKI